MAHTKENGTHDEDALDIKSRNEEKREFLIRKNIQMMFRGRLHIDPHTIPADKQYGWVLDDNSVEYGNSNMERAASRGWVPVTAKDRPDLCLILSNEREREKTVIKRDELVLHQRDKKFQEYEEKVLRTHNESVYQLDKADPHLNDPYMPAVVLKDQTSRTLE